MRFSASLVAGVAAVALLVGIAPVSAQAASVPAVTAAPSSAATAAAATTAAAPTPSAPTPVVDGTKLIDSRTGATFVPHSVNWPSFEYACAQNFAYSATGATLAAAKAMRTWDINTVRLPLNQSCWLDTVKDQKFRDAAAYKKAVTNWVTILNSVGIVVVLDLHWTEVPVLPTTANTAGQKSMPDARSADFWTSVSKTFVANRSVMFDAFNEPYSYEKLHQGSQYVVSWDCWRDGGCTVPNEDKQGNVLKTADGSTDSTYPAVGMQTLVSAIRATGATQPILLGGLAYSNDLTGWLEHVPTDPIASTAGGPQLVASTHVYNFNYCSTVSCWNETLKPVASAVPLFVGEVGQNTNGSTMVADLMGWADGLGVGYSPWAWWDLSNDETATTENLAFALIADAAFTPKAPAGTSYRAHLLGLPGAKPGPLASTVKSFTFETGISGWKTTAKPVTLKGVKKAASAHTGSRFLSAKIGAKKNRAIAASTALTSEIGDSYTATVWIRSGTTSAVSTTVKLVTRGGTAEAKSKTVKVGRKWTAVKVTLPIKRAKHTTVEVAITIGTAKHTVYVDDVAVVRTR